MQKPPPISAIPRFPITSGLCLLAIGVTIAWWSGWSIDSLVSDSPFLLRQPWRLLTSSLPHVSIFHLAFNIYWIWVFGTLLEPYFGTPRYLAIVIVLAAVPDAAQLAFLAGGVGLSGVGYGLFGLLYVLSQREPRFKGVIDSQTVIAFVVWFFLCILLTVTHILPVANVAHGAGALLGAGIGWITVSRASAKSLAAAALSFTSALLLALALFFRPFVNLSPDGGDSYAQAGYHALERKDPQTALDLYNQALSFHYQQANWFYNRGVANERLAHFKAAAADFQQAARLDPANLDYRRVADRERDFAQETATAP
jgi:GlpG protein